MTSRSHLEEEGPGGQSQEEPNGEGQDEGQSVGLHQSLPALAVVEPQHQRGQEGQGEHEEDHAHPVEDDGDAEACLLEVRREVPAKA
jgi:hypothetical protein